MIREEPRPAAARIHARPATLTGASLLDAAVPAPLPLPVFEINEARALFDGDAYDEMIAMVGRAERSACLEFFLFGGPVAEAMIDRLAVKTAAGVQVQVTLDRAQGILPQIRRECRAAYRRMLAEGIDVVLSDPRPFPNSPARLAMTHSKFLVVDDREALVGGMNIGTPFFRHHDVMIALNGPAAASLGRQFVHDRQFVLDPRAPRPAECPPLPPYTQTPQNAALAPAASWVRLLGTGVGRQTTRLAILQNLRAAHSSVCITMSEMGRTGVLDEVIAAKDRGVNVRVLLDLQDIQEYLPSFLGPLRQHCLKMVLNAHAIRTLLAAGVPVRLFDVGKEFAILHMKMAVFDAKSAIVGSTNWTRGGFEWIGETDVEMHGGTVIDELLAQFAIDWDRSAPAAVPPRSSQLLCRLYERLVQ